MSIDALNEALETYVPTFAGEPRRWEDVLRRVPRRRARWRRPAAVAALAAVVVAALAPLGLGGRLLELVRPDRRTVPHLPKGADLSAAAFVRSPPMRRILLEAAPMRNGDGMCYVYYVTGEFGCSRRSPHGALFKSSVRPFGYTFDRRAVSADVRLVSGKRLALQFVRFNGRIGAAFFYARHPLFQPVRAYYVRDRAGTVILRTRGLH